MNPTQIAAESAKKFCDHYGGNRYRGELAQAFQAAIEKAVAELQQSRDWWRDRAHMAEHGTPYPRAAQTGEPIICPYCEIEQETLGGFIAHLKLLHPRDSQAEKLEGAFQAAVDAAMRGENEQG